MDRWATFLTVLLVFWVASFSVSWGKVRSYDDLSVSERLTLQDSENRLIGYDRALQALDVAFNHRRISRSEFAYENHDLTAFICAEAKFQNDILTRDSGFDEDAREVMQNIQKYTTLIAGGILYLAMRCAPSLSFSP